MHAGTRLPPAREVVVLGDLVEAQLFVVVGADPFGGVDGALLQRRIDVRARDLLRDHAQGGEHRAAETGDAHLDALDVLQRLDLLAEPAAHLHAGVAAGEGDDVVVAVELVEQLLAIAVVDPGVELAGIHAEGNRGADAEGLVLADIVVGAGVAGFDGAVLHHVQCLAARGDFATGKNLDLELAAGDGGDALRQHFGAAVNRV
jgi:hypothetical protein